MTEKRTTVVLSVIAGLLLAFILIAERGTLSTSDVARRSGHVLSRFVRDRVTHVELERRGEPAIVFERGPADEEGELGRWRIAAPVEADSDEDAVESFLGALEWLMPERTLDGIDDADRQRYGLSEPRAIVRFRVGGDEVALRVGGPSTQPEGVYVAVDGQDRAFVVGNDFVEAVDHDLAHFRDKELFARDFYSSDARELALAADGARTRFEKDGELWHVREPIRAFANAGAIDRILRITRELRAERFVAEEARELGRYGLERPWRELTVTRPEDARGTRQVRLRVGAPCGEHARERYAVAGDRGPIVCVLESAVAGLELSADDAREARLLPLGPDTIERARLESGETTIELVRESSGWQLASGGSADDAAVDEWLRQLRESRAQAFEPLEGEAGRGVATPSATLTLTPTTGAPIAIRLGEVGDDGAWVRRGDEPALVRYEADVAPILRPDPLRFRDRALVGEEAADARRIRLVRDGEEERALRGEGGEWRLEAPLTVEADRVVVREVARQVAELRATRFVAPAPVPEHGLATPRLVAEVRFEPEGEEASTARLRIGAPSADGAYAQLEGHDHVFEVSQAVVDSLDAPLVSRDLLSVDLSSVESIRIEREGEPVADLVREGLRWRTRQGGSTHGERTRDLLERLAGLRAEGVLLYGRDPEPALGLLDPPATRVTLGRASGDISIDIGHDQDGGAYVPVRGTEAAVVYRFRPDQVRIFRTYTP